MTHGQPDDVAIGKPESKPNTIGTPAGQEQKVSWLELFFDLIFVVAFDQLAKRLGDSAGAGWETLGSFAVMFIAVWWAWASNALFAARYGNESRSYNWGSLAQVVTIAIIATVERGDLKQTGAYFAVCFGLNRLIQAGLHFWADRQTPADLTLSRRVAALLLALGLGWVASALLPSGSVTQLGVWAVLVAADLLSPRFIQQKGLLPHEGHLPERIGLLQIIALGGVINELVNGSRQQELTLLRLLPSFYALALVIAVWRLYFDQARALPLILARRHEQAIGLSGWLYGHLPLTLSIVMLGVGLGHGLSSSGPAEAALRQQFVVWPLAGIFVNIAFLRWNSRRVAGHVGGDRSLVTLGVGAIAVAALAFFDLDTRQVHGLAAALSLVVAAIVATDPATRTLGKVEEKLSEQLEEQAEQQGSA